MTAVKTMVQDSAGDQRKLWLGLMLLGTVFNPRVALIDGELFAKYVNVYLA